MRLLHSSAVCLSLLLGACAGAPEPDADTETDVGSYTAAVQVLPSKQVKVLGSMSYGDTAGCQTCTFATTVSKYRAYKFQGHAGDPVDVWVRSPNGDAMGWLLDANYRVLTTNDNASPGVQDSHIVYTLKDSGTYMVAFREHDLHSATFHVTVVGNQVNQFNDCAVDADCMGVNRVGCCPNGVLDAVNQREVKSYQASYTCPDKAPICPLARILDTRQPECNAGTAKCEMVDIAAIKCGGFIKNAHACPAGYHCNLGTRPDVPGSCVAN